MSFDNKYEVSNHLPVSHWGLVRSLINNLVIGVESGFTKTLEVNGVGYRAATEGDILQLQLGYSHDIKVAIPKEN